MIKFFKAIDAMTEEDTRRPWWHRKRKPTVVEVSSADVELREAERRHGTLLIEVQAAAAEVVRLSIAFERARRNAR